MKDIVISITDLSKLYRLGEVGTGTISHDLNRWWHRIKGKEDPYLRLGESNNRNEKGGDYVWALRDVSFDVQQGEVLGIVGKNGAGKSTLLKLLSRVTSPTKGTIRAKGRIASLLEVGTGFHPELTGRENVFLNGAILGMTRREIREKFDEIIDFAGVERFIDTPVKRYSSGMYVRLAFAVAANLEAEILIVDEVLAVGDAEFQRKCLGKMKDVSQSQGRTVLFVSHNMGAVKNLCNQALLIDKGTLNSFGQTSQIIEKYLTLDADVNRFRSWSENEKPGDGHIKLSWIKVSDDKGSIDTALSSEMNITIEIAYSILSPIKNLRVAANIIGFDGTEVFSTSDYRYQNESRLRTPGNYISKFTIPGNTLNLSRYYVSVDLDIPAEKAFVHGQVVSFSIDELIYNELGVTIAKKPSGIIHPVYQWHVNKMME